MILSAILAAGSAASLTLGAVDTPRARRGRCAPEQPVLLVLLSAALGWLSFATWPQ